MIPGKNHNSKSSDHPGAIKAAWTPSRIIAVAALSCIVLAIFLLVPPTTVQADRMHSDTAAQREQLLVSGLEQQADQTLNPGDAAASGSITSGFVLVEEEQTAENPAGEPAIADSSARNDAPATEIAWKSVRIKRGDTLTHVFKKAGLQARDAYELLGRCPDAKQLSRIHPGHELDFHIEGQQLQALRYRKNELESQVYTRQGENFSAETIVREPERRVRYKTAGLEDSLFMSGKRAGLDHNIIMQLANVFGGVIDFIYDPRKGDEFSILYEDLYLDGKKIGTGNILAAEYVNVGESLVAYRYTDADGNTGYYAPDGVSMQKAFLRAPLDFTRISSNFNLRRLHPIHKSVRAHRGIDYAAPRGTPVYAAGDGRVIKAGYSRANGNYIFISHGPQYTTKYLHLTKRYVKRLQKVEKGQTIGTVGSTGYATGPHLHYEFLVNGVHRNPRTILNKLPKAKSIADKEMLRFKENIESLAANLEKHQQAYQLAELDVGSFTPAGMNARDSLN